MRICIVGSSKRFFSGITTHTIFLANALAKHHQVSVVLLRQLLPRFLFPGREHMGKDQYSVDFAPGIEVYDGMDYNLPWSWLGACRFLRKERPEAIIMIWWSSSVAHMQVFLKLVNRGRIRAGIALDMHEVVDPLEESVLPIRLYSRLVGRRLVHGLDAYITHSQFAKARVAEVYRIRKDMISVVPIGLYEDYKQPIDSSLSKEELGIKEEFAILYFGLIRHYKGVTYLVKAFDLLPPPIATRSRLLIVGEIWEEGELLRDLIHASPYRSQIDLVAQYVPDVMIPKYFSAADVVALPYLRTAGSGVANIAMPYAKPIITSDLDAMRECLSGYEGALFVPPGDPAAIAEKLAKTYDLYASGKSIVYCPPQNTWDEVANQYAQIAKQISANG
jgi:glycosyltransferase involved in cell wall biosynthesis